jgi:hypothetical protein
MERGSGGEDGDKIFSTNGYADESFEGIVAEEKSKCQEACQQIQGLNAIPQGGFAQAQRSKGAKKEWVLVKRLGGGRVEDVVNGTPFRALPGDDAHGVGEDAQG